MKSVLIVLMSLTMVACNQGKITKPIEGQKLSGINGDAYYYFGKNGRAALVIKEEFYQRPDAQVSIYQDTVLLNDRFEASVITREHFALEITGSIPIQMFDTTESVGYNRHFTFQPTEEGIFTFRGRLTRDTVIIPFEYRFVVMKSR